MNKYDDLKTKMPCDLYATRHLGLSLRHDSVGLRGRGFYPQSKNPTSLVVSSDFWFDFGAARGGDVIDMCAEAKHNGNRGLAIKSLCELTGLSQPEFARSETVELEVDASHKRLSKEHRDYCRSRRITDSTIDALKIGTDNGRLVIPYWRCGRPVYTISRGENPKYKKRARGDWIDHPIWGIDTLSRPDPVIIAEGAFDAMSCYQDNYAVVSAITGRFSKAQEKTLFDVLKNREVVICMDYDPKTGAGEKFTYALAQKLFARIGPSVSFRLFRGGDEKIDLSSLYQTGKSVDEIIADSVRFDQDIIDNPLTKAEFSDLVKKIKLSWSKPDQAEFFAKIKAANVYDPAWLGEVKKQKEKIKGSIQLPGNGQTYTDLITQLTDTDLSVLGWYNYHGDICRIEGVEPVEITAPEAVTELELAATFTNQDGDKSCLRQEQATNIIKAQSFKNKLRRLRAVEPAHVFTINGFTPKGYANEIYTACDVPIRKMLLEDAVEVMDTYTGEFCFEVENAAIHKGNVIAVMASLFCRGLYVGNTPAIQVVGNRPGIGKGELIKGMLTPYLGHAPAVQIWEPDDSEIRKRMLAVAKSGTAYFWIDDLWGSIKSPAINAVLTSGYYSDRVLGRSRIETYPWRSMLFLSGNNYSLSEDLARRSIIINLNYDGESIDDRVFSIKDIEQYAIDNRAEILSAIYTIIDYGRSIGDVCHDQFTSFYGWSSVIGGIIRSVYPDALRKRAEISSDANLDREDIEALVDLWRRSYPSIALDSGKILEICRENEIFQDITHLDTPNAKRRLGWKLRPALNRDIGGYRIVRVQKRPALYRLE